MGGNGTPRTLRTVERTCAILSALADSRTAGVTELATELDLSKGGVYNHLATLRDQGLVVRESDEYRLSYRFLGLGKRLKQRDPLVRAARPEMEALSEETDETLHLMVEEFGRGVNIHQVQGENAVAREFHRHKTGKPLPLHWNAPGKSILAFLPESRVAEILDERGLEGKTEHTITDRETLFDELETIRERGFALNDNEEIVGMRAVGAPIVDADGRVFGAISISAPETRMTEEQFYHEYPETIKEASNVIEVALTTDEFDY